MKNFIYIFNIIFGGLSVYFISIFIVLCTKYIHFIIHEEKEKGIIVGYKVHRYSSHNDIRTKYIPQIKYKVDGKYHNGFAIYDEQFKRINYNSNDLIEIGYHKLYPEYFFIKGNITNKLFICIYPAMGFLYIIVLNYLDIARKVLIPTTLSFNQLSLYAILFQLILTILLLFKVKLYKLNYHIASAFGVIVYAIVCVLSYFIA